MDEEEKQLRQRIMEQLMISGEWDVTWVEGYIDISGDIILSIVNDLVALIREREQAAYQRGLTERKSNE